MKELLFKIAGVVVVLIIVCSGLTFTENEIIDRYNPLVIEKMSMLLLRNHLNLTLITLGDLCIC